MPKRGRTTVRPKDDVTRWKLVLLGLATIAFGVLVLQFEVALGRAEQGVIVLLGLTVFGLVLMVMGLVQVALAAWAKRRSRSDVDD